MVKIVNKYYYIMMSQQDFLKNLAIEEIIRERTSFYLIRKNFLNFWVIMSPLFLSKLETKIQKTNFYTQKKNDLNFNNQLYSTIIISTDPEYISWLRLRIGYFENIDETSESNGNRTFKSDGIYGEFNKNECEITSPFTTLKYNIHPLLLIDKCKSSLVEFLTLYEKNVNS